MYLSHDNNPSPPKTKPQNRESLNYMNTAKVSIFCSRNFKTLCNKGCKYKYRTSFEWLPFFSITFEMVMVLNTEENIMDIMGNETEVLDVIRK